jgi:predicted XRE-type DNA-binding protein
LLDLRFPDAEELSPKTMLASRLNQILDRRRLTQMETGRILRTKRAKVSALRNDKLRGISLERLMQGIVALDQNVEIIVRPRGRSRAPAAIRAGA